MWILVVLAEGPRSAVHLHAEIRRRNGPIGPGTLFGAIARLEAAALIERAAVSSDPIPYRLTSRHGGPVS
jgi:DNA-binding PadR family transcriptional regulator